MEVVRVPLVERRSPAIVAGWVVVVCLAGAAAAGAAEVPNPGRGRWAATTLALLDHNRELCDSIAGRVLAFWAELGSTDGGEQKARDLVLHDAVSELAAARAAGDFAHRFLRGARGEVGLETGASLERLSNLQNQLCNLVALPTAPYVEYEAALRDLGERIAREKAELGRLLVVPEAELRGALAPYLVPIQLAGVEAEGKLIDYLSSLKKEPEPPTLTELMAGWHRSIYGPGVNETKQALGKVIAARRSGDSRNLSSHCRELTAAVVTVLEDPRILAPPDPNISPPLRKAYLHIQRLAGECIRGDFRSFDYSLKKMQYELQVTTAALERYSLRP